jgi:hypothetical protein
MHSAIRTAIRPTVGLCTALLVVTPTVTTAIRFVIKLGVAQREVALITPAVGAKDILSFVYSVCLGDPTL